MAEGEGEGAERDVRAEGGRERGGGAPPLVTVRAPSSPLARQPPCTPPHVSHACTTHYAVPSFPFSSSRVRVSGPGGRFRWQSLGAEAGGTACGV